MKRIRAVLLCISLTLLSTVGVLGMLSKQKMSADSIESVNAPASIGISGIEVGVERVVKSPTAPITVDKETADAVVNYYEVSQDFLDSGILNINYSDHAGLYTIQRNGNEVDLCDVSVDFSFRNTDGGLVGEYSVTYNCREGWVADRVGFGCFDTCTGVGVGLQEGMSGELQGRNVSCEYLDDGSVVLSIVGEDVDNIGFCVYSEPQHLGASKDVEIKTGMVNCITDLQVDETVGIAYFIQSQG